MKKISQQLAHMRYHTTYQNVTHTQEALLVCLVIRHRPLLLDGKHQVTCPMSPILLVAVTRSLRDTQNMFVFGELPSGLTASSLFQRESLYVYLCMSLYVFVCLCMCIFACVCLLCMNLCECVCMSLNVYVYCMYVCVCVSACVQDRY